MIALVCFSGLLGGSLAWKYTGPGDGVRLLELTNPTQASMTSHQLAKRKRRVLLAGVSTAVLLGVVVGSCKGHHKKRAPRTTAAPSAAAPAVSASASAPRVVKRPKGYYAGRKVFQGPDMTYSCSDYYFDKRGGTLYRVGSGGDTVVNGALDVVPSIPDEPRESVTAFADYCPPNVIVLQSGKLLQVTAKSRRPHYSPATGTYKGYAPYIPASRTLLEAAFHPGREIFWMDSQDISCRGYRVTFLRPRPDESYDRNHREDADLRSFISRRVPKGSVWGQLTSLAGSGFSFPFVLVVRAKIPLLLLGTKLKWGKVYMKCRCERVFRVMGFANGELRMLGRALPGDPGGGDGLERDLPSTSPDILAYDPGQTERWFDSKKRCEKYLDQAMNLVGADGRLATRVGFHASDDAFDLY